MGRYRYAETGLDVLILAPLAVAQQTVEEGAQIGVSVNHAREADQIRPGVNITNYDRVHKFDASRFGAVVLTSEHHKASRGKDPTAGAAQHVPQYALPVCLHRHAFTERLDRTWQSR